MFNGFILNGVNVKGKNNAPIILLINEIQFILIECKSFYNLTH